MKLFSPKSVVFKCNTTSGM